MEKLNWHDNVSTLKGVGPKTHQLLGELGIFTIRDLLFHFPFRFEDFEARDIQTVMDQEKITLKGVIISDPIVNYYGARKNRLSFKLKVSDDDIVQVIFFNQHYLKNQLELGQEIGVYGKWQASNSSILGMKLLQIQTEHQFNPVYPTTKGLRQTQLIKLIEQALELYSSVIPELIPQSLNDYYELMPLGDALKNMHFPDDMTHHQQAERKIIYQEFFMFQWRLQLNTQVNQKEKGIEVHYDVGALRSVIDAVPFELTDSQKSAINEICFDLMAPFPMHRLLQGDVGSGKTLVAFITMIAAVIGGYQVALMAPTEILAQQHQISFDRFFNAIGLKAELLTGSLKTKERTAVLEGLSTGRIRIVIGTHALFQEQVEYHNLAYIVIDEQHRFGVQQRQSFKDKGKFLNTLQMTATPIPRSLALSIYGEMSVSTLTARPSGRLPIETHWLKSFDNPAVLDRLEQTLKDGHQAYVVLPLIEESDNLSEVENVKEIANNLQNMYKDYHVGVLHGQMTKDEQESAMALFQNNLTQILVATTMVEVGVDVPNAVLMIILSAERFGLAQLHQLRGRVGRSDLQSYCYLIADAKTEQARHRMEIMTKTTDGFVISREDMKLRGIGDVLGIQQSGIPQFKYANIIEDQIILQAAQRDVQAILGEPSRITEQEWDLLVESTQMLTIGI